MKVTYNGPSESVRFDRVTFQKGVPTEYDGKRADKLAQNRFFSVEEPDQTTVEAEAVEERFPTGSKEELAAWAKENLGLEFHHRKGLGGMIAEVEERLAQ